MPELERWVLHRVAEIDAQVRAGYEAYDFQGVWRAVFEFATLDLSSFYFDVRKDALYCDAEDGARRRACLHVLGALFERLTTWLAPVLVFTTEEVWLERRPGEGSSVHLQDMPATCPRPGATTRSAGGGRRSAACAASSPARLEEARRDKAIGASLEAAPTVHVDGAAAAILREVAFDELCIVSGVSVTEAPAPEGAFALADAPGVAVAFARAEGDKCLRCWKILPDVGTHAHPGTCARCDAALA